jgi:hypothetical protein
MLKNEVNNKTEILIYTFIYFPTLFYGSESWTVLTRCDSRVAGAEIS